MNIEYQCECLFFHVSHIKYATIFQIHLFFIEKEGSFIIIAEIEIMIECLPQFSRECGLAGFSLLNGVFLTVSF